MAWVIPYGKETECEWQACAINGADIMGGEWVSRAGPPGGRGGSSSKLVPFMARIIIEGEEVGMAG
jgi:hypothetical protein